LPVADTCYGLINPSGTMVGSAKVRLTSTTATKAVVRSAFYPRCDQPWPDAGNRPVRHGRLTSSLDILYGLHLAMRGSGATG
jgi:hypothetical protein